MTFSDKRGDDDMGKVFNVLVNLFFVVCIFASAYYLSNGGTANVSVEDCKMIGGACMLAFISTNIQRLLDCLSIKKG